MSFSEIFHVIRTVRKASVIGKEVGRAEQGKAEVSPLSAFEAMRMTSLVSQASFAGGPGVAAAAAGGLAVLAILGYFSQFIQPGGNILLSDPNSGMAYADQARQALLVKIFGSQAGNAIFQNEFSNRTIEVDLRSKYP
jgi:hypothetical protein